MQQNFKVNKLGLHYDGCVTFDQSQLIKGIWNVPNSSQEGGMAAPSSKRNRMLDPHDGKGNVIRSQIELSMLFDLQESMKEVTCNLLSNKTDIEKQIIEQKTELLNKLYVTISLHVGATNDYQELYQLALGVIKCGYRFKTEIEVFNSVACTLMLVQYFTATELDDRCKSIIDICSLKLKPHHLDYLDTLFKMKRKWHVNYARDGWGEQIWLTSYLTNFKSIIRWLCQVKTRNPNDGTGFELTDGCILTIASDMSLIYATLVDSGALDQFYKISPEVATLNHLTMVGKPPNCTCLSDLSSGYLSEGINPGDPGEVLLAAYTCYLIVHWNAGLTELIKYPPWFSDFICLTSEAHLMTEWSYYEIQVVDLVTPAYLPKRIVEEGRTSRALRFLPLKLTGLSPLNRVAYDHTLRRRRTSEASVTLPLPTPWNMSSNDNDTLKFASIDKLRVDQLIDHSLRKLGIRQLGQYVPKSKIKAKKFQLVISDFLAEETN